MVRLAISVEGTSEALIVDRLLAPHLANRGVFTTPIRISTGKHPDGRKASGGGVNVDRVVGELQRLLRSYDHVSTLYDLYGFGKRSAGETADALQARIAERLGAPTTLICYVQQYELESLFLSDPLTLANCFHSPGLEQQIEEIVSRAGGAEEVNDSPHSAPSKRLEAWSKAANPGALRYNAGNKLPLVTALSDKLRLSTVRTACPRFDAWVSRLEALGHPAGAGFG